MDIFIHLISKAFVSVILFVVQLGQISTRKFKEASSYSKTTFEICLSWKATLWGGEFEF